MAKKDNKKTSDGNLRPPIVTILGHVDHGKTTLLDKIRKTKVVSKEAGGITQSIGASIVKTEEGKRITFIDTPGHAAFSQMRSRGAQVADIAVLVVASDDGVKPQTEEALKYIREAEIPFIVAINKIDLDTANEESTKSQLENEGVLFEGGGGDVPAVSVSGKTGKGIDDLLETISLVAEVEEIKGDEKASLEAVVIETGKEKRGPVVSVVVRNGRIKVQDEVFSEGLKAKVRGLFDHQGKGVKEVKPGDPGLILGFSDLPPVGSRVVHLKEDHEAKKEKEEISRVKAVEEGKIPVVIKSQSQGSLEAVLENLPEKVVVISSGVGEVTESDVFMAKSSNAYIFAFESKVPTSVSRLADTEGVQIEDFDVVYKLFERIEEIIKEGEEKIKGKAEIIKTFPHNDERIAGSRVLSGKIAKGDDLVLRRGEKDLGKIRIDSMKKVKTEVSEAKQGEEFGTYFKPQLDFKVGDMIVSLGKKE